MELEARAETSKKQRLARAIPPLAAYEVTLKNVSKPGLGELVKPKTPVADPDADGDTIEEIAAAPAEDIILHEAQNILTDYTSMLHGQPVVSQR